MHQFRTAVVVVVAFVLLCTVALPIAHTATAAPTPSSTFRCLRPFSAVNSFVAVSKAGSSQNCDFHYFTVTEASAELSCASTAATGDLPKPLSSAAPGKKNALDKLVDDHAEVDSDEALCNVTVRWSMRRSDNVVQQLQKQVGTDADYLVHNIAESTTPSSLSNKPPQRQQRKFKPASPFMTEDDDIWRYAVSLRAKGDSTVHYKGFNNGDGYSMCCGCLVEADCAWVAAEQGDNDLAADEEVNLDLALPQRRVLRGCPLPFPAVSNGEDGEGAAFGAAAAAATAGAGGFRGVRVALTDLEEEDVEEGGEAGVFHGCITKPLHRVVDGPWEVTVQMWRRREQQKPTLSTTDGSTTSAGPPSAVPADSGLEAEVLGRVVVPFTLDLVQLRKEGRLRRVTSMALTVEDVMEVAAVPAVPAPKENAGEGDGGDL